MLDMLNGAALMVMTSVGHRTGLLDALRRARRRDESRARGRRRARRALRPRVARRDDRRHASSSSIPTRGGIRCPRSTRPGSRAQPRPTTSPSRRSGSRASPTSRTTSSSASGPGGGVPYDRYPRFHEVMAEESAQTVFSVLFTHILPLVPGMSERLEAGASLLDLGLRPRARAAPARRALSEEHVSRLRPLGRRRSPTRPTRRSSAGSTTCPSSSVT